MKLPLTWGITAGVKYYVTLSARGNDYSATTRDGFHLTHAGFYLLLIEAADSNSDNFENTLISFYNLPTSFVNFWVWSLNKMMQDLTVHEDSGRTTLKIFFKFPATTK
jgi:hypothetical protein